MEWLVVLVVAAAAAAYILLPRRGDDAAPEEERVVALRLERATLLDLLRELDEDAATGRISADDRLEGRRALGPRLREVTEALQRLGEHREPLSVVRPDDESPERNSQPDAAVTEPVEPRS